MRINIPSNPDEFIKLALAISAQHTKLGAASPLNGIEGIADFPAQAAAADASNKQASDLYKQAETAIEARDNAIGPNVTTPDCLRFFVSASRDVLGGVNKGNEHKLGVWGFEVNASPQATPEQKAAAKAARAAVKAAKNKPAS